jgi:hypothetical protein
MDFEVRKIDYKDTLPWLLNKHYAQRVPSISYSYGLFDEEELIGVCTVGKPASPSLCRGICGEEFKDKVYELNRLVLKPNLPKNSASFFIGAVLRDLKEEDLILVSYADEGMNHFGYIYQATNWFYTGKTNSRTDKYMPGNKHSRHYTDEFKHLRKFRSSKHRYVYFTGKSKKKYLKNLNYEIQDYPKGEPERYKLGTKKKTKIIDTKNDKVFYE